MTATLAPGTRATVTVPLLNTWVGDIPSGVQVVIVDFDAQYLDEDEDYVGDLGDGRLVSFPASHLAPTPTAS